MEATLPVVTTETKVLAESSATSFGGIGKSLTGMLGGLRSIAYIIPGIGLAGLFNLAFEAIVKAADALKIFNNQEKELADAQDKAVESISEEASKVSILVTELKDENISRNNKLRIIKELQTIAPAYFSDLKLEGDTVAGLVEDYAKYGRSILLVSKIKAASDLNQKNVTKEIESQLQTSKDLLFVEQNRAKFLDPEAARMRALNEDLFRRTAIAKEEAPLMAIIIEAQKELNELMGDPKPTDNTKDKVKAVKELKQATEVVIPKIKEVFDIMVGSNALGTVNTELTKTGSLMKGLPVIDFSAIFSSIKAKKALEDFNKQMATLKNIASEVSSIFANLFVNILTTGKISFKQLAQEVARFVGQLIEAVLQTAILKILTAALTGGTSAVGFGLANWFNSGIPHLAGGGMVSSPTLALVGEAGPEAVIPLSQMQSMSNGMSNNMTINGVLKAHGSDLVLVLNRSNVRISRNNGSNFN